VARVVQFGSRARGDARPDSDCDVAIFFRDLTDRFAEMDRIAGLSAELLDETGELVQAMPYCQNAYEDRTPLMHEIRADGVAL
jgi:predicted nucleotidyltransferase